MVAENASRIVKLRPLPRLTVPGIAAAIGAAIALRLAGLDWRVSEALLILAVLGAVGCQRAVWQALAGFDRSRRALAAGLLVALLAGQFLAGRAFPFASWRMYGTAATSVAPAYGYHYDGRRADGTTVPLIPSRLLGGITANRLTARLLGQVERLRTAPDEALRREHEASILALARRYNDRHPRAQVEAVDVSRVELSSEKAEVLWRIPVA